jgi:hypothetical protein
MKLICSIFTTLILVISSSINSFDNKEEFNKILEKYYQLLENTDEYSFSASYRIEVDALENETIQGIIGKKQNNLFQKIDQLEMLSDGKVFLKIDPKSKTIQVAKKQENFSFIKNFDIKKFSSQFKSIEMLVKGEQVEFQLTGPLKNQNPYEKIKIQFDKTNNFLNRIEAIYLLPVEDKNGNKVKPKLIIENKNFQKKISEKLNFKTVQDIIIVSKNDIKPTQNYKEYTVIN